MKVIEEEEGGQVKRKIEWRKIFFYSRKQYSLLRATMSKNIFYTSYITEKNAQNTKQNIKEK